MTWIAALSLSPEYGSATLTIAIHFPSDDHAMGDAGELGGWLIGRLQLPDVRRRAPVPSSPITHRCAGIGAAVTKKSLLPTSNESLNFSSPAFLDASSDAT